MVRTGLEKPVMVFIEYRNNRVADVSIELLGEANRLAEKLGVPVEALALGYNIEKELEILGQYGCSRIYYMDDKRLSQFSTIPYTRAIVDIVKRHEPQIFLFGGTIIGRDVAPRVASELRCGLTADCTGFRIGQHKVKDKIYDNTLLQIRPAFGGNIIATIVSPESCPSMATVREGVMKRTDPDSSKTTEIIGEDCDLSEDDFMTEILDVVYRGKTVNLKSAKTIVSAGMGAGNPRALELIKELADLLGGEVGASRPVVDSGLLGKDHQVGQTGTAVNPNLYIACGISGQIQHRAGIEGAKRIVAINKDAKAPIFSIAHYGIVGDVNDVLPKMIKAYREKRRAQEDDHA